ncbi:hypothetical protein GCM10011374_36260 [Kocuria dechangensis]|uniref:Uncharacterized protein n=1 Tax=Kocuria dechangensis TaxID=1176249 RepID=A0A917H5V2_9MICC|nr:hypothetical protein [Kocuria dechangensis]GGG68621.1 hypothetical protein GCM10011374_36260 [Kocuria dechangensis]
MSSSIAPAAATPRQRITMPSTAKLSSSALAQAVTTIDGRPIVLCDIDGVKAKWLPGVIRLTQRIAAERGVPNPLTLEHPTWDMLTYDEDANEIIREAMCHPELYGSLEPEDGSVEALHTMQAEIGEVFLASTAMPSNPTAHSAKAEWVGRVYGTQWADRLILTADKTALRGVVLIDDKPEITGVMRPLWEHIVFHRRYNAETAGVRIHDWSEESLETIAATVERRLHELAG